MMVPLFSPAGRLVSAAGTKSTVRVTGVVEVFWDTESHGVVVLADTPVIGAAALLLVIATVGKVGTLPLIV
jgi:hypothetical protein